MPRRRSYDMTARAASAAQTRERVLERAYQLACEHHYDDVSLKQIAEAAGVSVQTVIVHFQNKENLLRELHAWHAPRERAMREVPVGDVLAAAKVIGQRYAEVGPPTLRLLQIEDRVATAHELLERGRELHRAWVERTFGPVLPAEGPARARALAGLAAAYDLYTWQSLRARLGPEDTALAMAAMARGVLRAEDK